MNRRSLFKHLCGAILAPALPIVAKPVWEPPQMEPALPGTPYLIAVDLARGHHADVTYITVISPDGHWSIYEVETTGEPRLRATKRF